MQYEAAGTTEGIPWDIQEEVELWAREIGRHAKIVWNPVLACPEVQIELKDGDPRLKKWQAGDAKRPHKPVESVWLHRWNEEAGHYEPMDLGQMGASGVRAHLERANMWSGRGRHRDLYSAAKAADEHNEQLKAEMRKAAMDNSRDMAKDRRRDVLGIPLVTVQDDLE